MISVLVSVALLIRFAASATVDCIDFAVHWEIPRETICVASTGLCQNIFWTDASRSSVCIMPSALSVPVTCREACEFVTHISQGDPEAVERIMATLNAALTIDLIPRSLEFPFIDPSWNNWDRLRALLEELSSVLPQFEYAPWIEIRASYFSDTSIVRTWGRAVEMMIATLHNAGGSRGFAQPFIEFAEKNRDLILTIQDLVHDGETLLLEPSFDIDFSTEPIEPADADSVENRIARLNEQIQRMQTDQAEVDISWEDFEPFVSLLEILPKDRIEDICRDFISPIIPRLDERILAELIIRVGHVCKSHLTLEIREYIIHNVLLFPGGYGLEENGDDPLLVEIDQTLDDEQFFIQSKSILMNYNRIDFYERSLFVRFTDSGSYGAGVTREWFTRMFRFIFAPTSGFFEYTDDRRSLLRPAPIPREMLSDVRLASYRTIGQVIALAWTQDLTIGVPLGHSVIAYLSSPRLWDLMESFRHDDPLAFRIFSDPSRFTASGDIPFFEEDLQDVDHSIMVNETNVHEYIHRQLVARTVGNCQLQLQRIALGIHDILSYTHLSFYTISEISDRLRGPTVVDLDQLFQTTSYTVAWEIDAVTAQTMRDWIWASIRSLDPIQMQDFLEFVSGSPYPPVEGFVDESGEHWLQIRLEDNFESRNPLPTSRTCFKSISFGLYDSFELLKQRLVTAITLSKEIMLE